MDIDKKYVRVIGELTRNDFGFQNLNSEREGFSFEIIEKKKKIRAFAI